MRSFCTGLILFFTCLLPATQLSAQLPGVAGIITVHDGLPQSFVSGITQDNKGFLWIATLNGLCRYDGKQFIYWNSPNLKSSIILHLFNAGDNELLLGYMNGEMDLLNTNNGRITHFGNDASFSIPRKDANYFKSMVKDESGICWMMSAGGGLYKIDVKPGTVKHFSFSDLQLSEPILGIALQNNELWLFTKSFAGLYNVDGHLLKTVNYPFKTIGTFNTSNSNMYSSGLRANGQLIIPDSKGLILWNPSDTLYKLIPLKWDSDPGKLIGSFDKQGNYFFEHNTGILMLKPDDELVNWLPEDPQKKIKPISLYHDRSGILWIGTNGYGLGKSNVFSAGMRGYPNKHSFETDVLFHFPLHANAGAQGFLKKMISFGGRSASRNDSLWIANANYHSENPRLVLHTRNELILKTFLPAGGDTTSNLHTIKFIQFDESGHLWAMDQDDQLLQFDIQKLTFRIADTVNLNKSEDVNGMAPLGDSAFYISTTGNLVLFHIHTGQTEKLTQYLPTSNLFHICNDPDNKNILWIGTLSNGLIRFDKISRQSQTFDMTTGLPNNTIYSILPGNDGLLWCSSNKGIFSFNRYNHMVNSLTSQDGLIDDEFNRYGYLLLPKGRLAFRGPMGYTIFNPSELQKDRFNPELALTGLNIINAQKNTFPGTVSHLELDYNQNSFSASFAALQFDMPMKLLYRYQLAGFDKDWIIAGNENKAVYNGLPPGQYLLRMNASNTSGEWSTHFLEIPISIAPPIWERWWFYAGLATIAVLLVWLFLHLRISNIKKINAQKLQYERAAMELHAMALRSRMNPHFIFNCLNSIKALIQEAQNKKAVTYLTSFCTLIRKQLDNNGNGVLLLEELETCRLYLELEALRFDGRINYEFKIDDDLPTGVIIPPLLLQPVIENAVVHGLRPKENGGTIIISVQKKTPFIICTIEDDGVGRKAAAQNNRNSSKLHLSQGVQLLEERISVHNQMGRQRSSFQTIDLFHPGGDAAGTKVIITIQF